MPAAAPQATSKRSRAGETFAVRPSSEPSIEASCTIGPSRPIEPPEEIVTSDERLFTTVARTRITPLPTTTASMKSAERPACDHLFPKSKIEPAIRPPAVGITTRAHQGSVAVAYSSGTVVVVEARPDSEGPRGKARTKSRRTSRQALPKNNSIPKDRPAPVP